MTYTILVVIVMIAASGFIAYWGDILGRRMGKKRLTLFNLRPRHTAIVITTITGMIISTLVIGAAVSFNAEFRKGFFQYGQILKSRRLLAKENVELAIRGKQLRAEVARQRKELQSARKDAAVAKAQRDKVQSYVTKLQREIAERQKELAELSKRADAAQDELNQRRSEVKLVLADLRKAEESLKRAQEDVARTEEQLGVAQAKLEATQAKLAEEMSGGTKVADYVVRLRTSELAFRQGDELARDIIDPFQSSFELRRDVYSLLERASRRAVEGGAIAGDNGRAVNVIFRQTAGEEGLILVGNETTWVDKAVQRIASSDSEVLVQVVCAMTTLPNAQVPVEIRLYKNNLIYKKGDKIADAKVDGGQSEGHILIALNNLLQSDVAKAAMRAGVVPVAGADPRATLGDNREAQADEILRLMAQIKSMDATADVCVYATSDIRAADSINTSNIRFAVAGAK